MITSYPQNFSTLYTAWTIAWRLTLKEVSARYRGNILGWTWLLLVPLALIVVYTFVFYGIFTSRWSTEPAPQDMGPSLFAAQLLIGLSLFHYFSDFCVRSSRLLQEHQNLIKRVRFPLPTLVLAAWFSALIPLLVQLGMVVILGAWHQQLDWSWLSFPLEILLPFLLLTLGLGFVIAASSLFLKDVAHALPPAMALLMFLSPVFYSSAQTPTQFQSLLQFNPLSWPIEASRALLFKGQAPQTPDLLTYWVMSLIVLYLGARYFTRLSPTFADQL